MPKISIDGTEKPSVEKKPESIASRYRMTQAESIKKNGQKHQLFVDVSEKAKKLAKIFGGVVKSESNFSICKGQFSIRFNCQNEHNFYMTADQINRIDLDQVKAAYKKYRLQL